MMSATGVVSADRRYVRIAVSPIFSTIGDVQTFTFAGAGRRSRTRQGGGGMPTCAAVLSTAAARRPMRPSSPTASVDTALIATPAPPAARPGCPSARASGWRPARRRRSAGRRSLRRSLLRRDAPAGSAGTRRRCGASAISLRVHLVVGEVACAACPARLPAPCWPTRRCTRPPRRAPPRADRASSSDRASETRACMSARNCASNS